METSVLSRTERKLYDGTDPWRLREHAQGLIKEARKITNKLDKANDSEARDLEQQHAELIDKIDTLQSRAYEIEAESRGPTAGDNPRRPPMANDGTFTRSFIEQRGEHPERMDGFQLGDILSGMARRQYGERLNDREQRALDSTTADSTVPEATALRFFDSLRNATRVIQAGAQTVTMTAGKQTFAKLAGDSAATWRAENAAVAESDPTIGSVEMTAKTLAVVAKASSELLQDSTNLATVAEQSLRSSMAEALDLAALAGAGGDAPTGILNQPGIASGSIVEPTGYGELIDEYAALTGANVEPNALLMNEGRRAAFGKLTASDGQPLVRPSILDTTTFHGTNQMPDAATMIMGDFRQLLMGIRATLQIRFLDESRLHNNLQVGWLVWLRADVVPVHDAGFRIINVTV